MRDNVMLAKEERKWHRVVRLGSAGSMIVCIAHAVHACTLPQGSLCKASMSFLENRCCGMVHAQKTN